ncbi:MAG TPA: alpha/beta fold hydrolase [Vicinamibacteria bacterium]|nr:alpha/beta fold hydrolase [Vicinamibacteria bacterium]
MRSWFATRRGRWLARLVLYGSGVGVGLPLASSQALVGTVRQPTTAASAPWTEMGLEAGGLRLRAWLAEGAGPRPAVVAAHGLGDSLESYRELGETFHRRGHTVLLVDLRAHGGSEGGLTTLGGHEREDVRAAMRALRERGLAGPGFVLLGVSMGAVAVLRAAAVEPDVRAVVAEAPYATYRESIAHHARLYYGVPPWLPLLPAAIAVAEWRAGFDADEVDAVAAASRVRAPLLAIVDGADPRMPEGVVRRVYDAHPGPKRLWVAPGAPHAGASIAPGYWPEVLGFLESLGGAAAAQRGAAERGDSR